ncbi:hypothetical protein [Roseivivax sp. CAU 1761]
MFRKFTAAALVSAMGLAAAPAFAQDVNASPKVNANNLVNVNVENVANDLAENLSVDVSDIPVTVQAPIGVAANVCDVDANVLAQGGEDAPADCDAKNTSQALSQVVKKQMGG